MSMLSNWQTQIEEWDAANKALAENPGSGDAYLRVRDAEISWQAIARQALKIALAAEAAAEFMPLDVGEYYATELEVDTANDLRYELNRLGDEETT